MAVILRAALLLLVIFLGTSFTHGLSDHVHGGSRAKHLDPPTAEDPKSAFLNKEMDNTNKENPKAAFLGKKEDGKDNEHVAVVVDAQGNIAKVDTNQANSAKTDNTEDAASKCPRETAEKCNSCHDCVYHELGFWYCKNVRCK